MNTIAWALAALTAAAPAGAQPLEALAVSARAFEELAAAAQQEAAPENAFAGVKACGVLDILPIRPFTMEEASEMIQPCLEAALRKYQASARIEPGFIKAPQEGRPGHLGLLIKTDLVPASKGHRDLGVALAERQDALLGHPVRALAQGEEAPSPASSLQKALDSCMTITLVRDIRNGADFLRAYGGCLRRDPKLKVTQLRPSKGLAVALKTEAAPEDAESYSGFVTVNVGKGPVRVLILAETAAPASL